MAIPYVHDENVHHMGSPEALVPVLMDMFHPASAVDFGCGIGTFPRAFRERGLEDMLGLDGPWVDREKPVTNIPKTYFREPGRFDHWVSQRREGKRADSITVPFRDYGGVF